MIIRGKIGMKNEELEKVVATARELGVEPEVRREPNVDHQAIIGLRGDTRDIEEDRFRVLPGVDEAIRVTTKHRYTSSLYIPEHTVIRVKQVSTGEDIYIGQGHPLVIMAGPCAVESREQLIRIAQAVKNSGAKILRGGAYKPRTYPREFEGLGEDGLKILKEASEITGLPVVTEVMEPGLVEKVGQYASIIQIGARSMQNFPLLDEVGRQDKPVLLKNGIATTIDEFLGAMERIMDKGNMKGIFCLRGFRSYDDTTRFTPNAYWAPLLRQRTHLPIVYDPSHPAGRANLVEPFARAGIAYGVDGLLIEVHTDATHAKTDAAQQITPNALQRIADYARQHEKLIMEIKP